MDRIRIEAAIQHIAELLGIGSLQIDDTDISQIIANPSSYRSLWRILANSFTEWLELIAHTHGTLGYQ